MSGIGEERRETPGAGQRGSSATRSVERAGQVLRLLADGGSQRTSDLAAAMQLPRRSVSELLRSLVCTGLVERDPRTDTYGLGPELVHLGSSYLRANELRSRAARWARLLARETEQIVQVGMLHGLNVLIVNHVGWPQDEGYVSDLGSLYPAHRTAIGKVLLANRPDTASLATSNSEPSLTEVTHSIVQELRAIRAQRWSASNDATTADASIACPVYERTGQVCGAIGVIGDAAQLLNGDAPRAELLERVRAAATSVSRAMGAAPW